MTVPSQITLTLHPAALSPGLYLAATPIGNARDVSLRLLEALMGADRVYCEDSRVTHKLLALYGLNRSLSAYHDHNGAQVRPRILSELADGQSVLLVSDAGTPLVSDPGYKLVEAAIEAGHAVTALPGPSAVLHGLAIAGLPTDQFFFAGFLPNKNKARRDRLSTLSTVPGTLVFFEAAPRLAACLTAMADTLGDRPGCVARELSKKFEEARRGPLTALAAHYAEAGPPKGEIVVLVGPQTDTAPVNVDQLLREALADQSVRDAAAEIAQITGLPKRDLYNRALALKNPGDDEDEAG